MSSDYDYPNINDDFFVFIENNAFADTTRLILSMKHKGTFDPVFAAIQIECRRKYTRKLPSFIVQKRFLFPDAVSGEQASDERVSAYHASMIPEGSVICDMTAGLGIDCMTISRRAAKVTAIELDTNKAAALRHNAALLGLDNFKVINTDSVEYIRSMQETPDIIFIDPARRDVTNKRTYSFADCLPDINLFYKDMLARGCRILVKASPLLDISQIISELSNISSIHIVCVKGECKEVLVDLEPESKDSSLALINAVDLDDNGIESEFSINATQLGNTGAPIFDSEVIGSIKDMYLYEPNAAVMKLPAAEELCRRFVGLRKASPDCAIYFSDIRFDEFPGRIMRVCDVITKKDFRRLKGCRYNVAVRNYPKRADELRKSLGVKEGSDEFIYGIRLGIKAIPTMLTATRLQRDR